MASDTDILGPVAEIGHGLMEGYLHIEPPLNSAEFVPAPPTENSGGWPIPQRARHCSELEGSARWDLASKRCGPAFPCRRLYFQLRLGATVGTEQTPALYRLLQRSLTDLGLATYLPGPQEPETFSSQRRIDLYAG